MKRATKVALLIVILIAACQTRQPSTGHFRPTAEAVNSAKQATIRFFIKKHRYPGSLDELFIESPHELEDQWGQAIRYEASKGLKRYVISSPGSDGKYDRAPSDYMYLIPPKQVWRQNEDTTSDFITANNCDWGMPYGWERCSEWDVSQVILRNGRDALAIYFDVNTEYPETFDTAALQKLARDKTKFAYQLSLRDGFGGRLTYMISADRKSYLLAAPGEDRLFSVPLQDVLNGRLDQFVRDDSDNADLIIMNGRPTLWYEALPF